MSRFSNIRIAKGGKLLADEWTYNRETRSGKSIKGVDISNKMKLYLTEKCNLEDEVTLEDILLLVDSTGTHDFLSPMLTRGPWLDEFIEEGFSAPDEGPPVDKIVLKWNASVSKDIFSDDNKEVLELYVGMFGTQDGVDDTFALDFTPLNRLKHCKIILDEEMTIDDERHDFVPTSALLYTHKQFTLFDILHGLFWEFSFHGSPAERNKSFQELSEIAKRIQSGEETGIPFEEFKEKFNKSNNK